MCDKENQQPTKVNALEDIEEDMQEEDAMSPSSRCMDDAINNTIMEKLQSFALKHNTGGEALKALITKIHARVTSSDKRVREDMLDKLWTKGSGAMEIFIIILAHCKDLVVIYSIAAILHECIMPKVTIGKSKGSKTKSATKSSSRIAVIQLINLGITQVLVKNLMNIQNQDSPIVDVLMQEVLWILGQISQWDMRILANVKSSSCIKIFHTLLAQHYNNSKMILPLLLITKTLAQNSFSQEILINDGIVNTLEKTLIFVGNASNIRLRVLVECLKYFTTNKLCCKKFVKIGIVNQLMRIFDRWERYEGQMRLKICNYALNTLQHLCVIKSGRNAIKSNNGLQLLYRFCTYCPEEKAYDCLLSRICSVINQCLEKKDLPVPIMSPARFNLPEANTRANSIESGSDLDSQANSVASLGRLYSDFDSGDDEDSHSSRRTSDKNLYPTEEIDESKFFAGVFTSQRTEENLIGYSVFFKELNNFQIKLEHTASNLTVNNEKTFTRTKGLLKETHKDEMEYQIKHKNILSNFKTLKDLSLTTTNQLAYCIIASEVKSVIRFVKVAYPDLIGGDSFGKPEPLNCKDRKVCREKLLTCVERSLHANTKNYEVVYNLDVLAMNVSTNDRISDKLLCNLDEKRIGKRNLETKCLQFESRFESGNLRKAIKIGLREYDLILTPDVNSVSRHQWFYFEVSNMEINAPYTFNIINCEKANSQFNFGMKPILFSVIEAQLGRPGWVRTGTDICYYRNCYQKPTKGKNYLTTTFTVIFPHAHDVCYLAYHFPYTYTQLMTNIWKWTGNICSSNIYFRADSYCESLNNNEIPLMTITAPDSKDNPISNRKVIFLTSRVHPGESNASWIMHGTLETLLSNSTYASSLRDDYVFKIVPMLNPEGVVNGCNRYGLTNEDLNRQWSNPDQSLHPVIYHTKGLMEYCTRVLRRPPHVFVDYHGHSRRKNVFLFGCSRSSSWSAADRAKPDQPVQYLMLPHLMQKVSPAFALPLCSFKVERNKESTARVAIWRELGISRSYTMESSFCGCDQGKLAGLHFDTDHLKDVGRDFCQALAMMKDADENLNIDKILMGETIPEESGCMVEEVTSSCDSDESDLET
ncbi:cytosolic carboxypeptidase 4-like isoform X1 [Polistes fuscatus]|uniref:cytosolic carboxypeptidase 4-like isoform X1 n=3 Tax=Polistes fuscatus TaxID=30207 RepID=UPI001CA86EF1|nr:cytosolic carboxypeptidase 4-like isoform X1 [Polistes fuscatus]XP_043505082.1 cytosolic carboxypeptidase 4-like isoform X1 [Polistes fuscatus]XP_043505083.1 cytosolic carboxypeptidase 4-like isoform X1 [Polistes fuscatus]XP_043505084.1 cytosolic carboxypeptidase 4-like isoform X1 [Polistes fuscatus]XP_043505085.1 cytosolic carboxypeptidase 4-like isoform X1 [Polistes fuscatus]XP_043505086.1 cytosolic carboxypeptidase 4-like isoform X1 [Polistes fuscatus]XP_043505087.1 cytosolic carboxypep